jgi:two-component system chemotaxis response regulator CheB
MLAVRASVIPAGQRARILIVDDSVLIRRLVTTALERVPDFEVVGTAANGKIALEKIGKLDPDVVTLDIEMPVMDGLETLKAIRAQNHKARVIMFSTLTERGGQAMLEALSLGADDYATKASNADSLNKSKRTLEEELVPKIRHLLRWEKPVAPLSPNLARAPRHLARRALVIGVSTGGPAALTEVLPLFPASFPVPVLVVQHMPAMFTRLLAERLQLCSRLEVKEAQEGDPVVPGRVLIAPGNQHLRVRNKSGKIVASLDRGPAENECRPAVDVLFRSTAEIWGGAVVVAIMTGMGQDGLKGTRMLAELGAYVVAQDEATSVVWGMPGAVVTAGLAHSVVGLGKIADEICKQF